MAKHKRQVTDADDAAAGDYAQAIINYGNALANASAAATAEALALMTYEMNPTPANAAALAAAVLATSEANQAVMDAWTALLAARQAYQQAGGGQ